LDGEGGWTVAGVGPEIQFQIVEIGILGTIPDDNIFSGGQFSFGELAGVGFAGEIFVPSARHSVAGRIAKVVGECGAEIVSASPAGILVAINVEPGNYAVSCR